MFAGRHFVAGRTSKIALVSEASHPWNCRVKVSREHWPMKQNSWLEQDRRSGVALRRKTKARIGMIETIAWYSL